MDPAAIEPSTLVSNKPLGAGWYVMRLRQPDIARGAEPGQFVQVLCAGESSTDPLLRRPFSVYCVDPLAGNPMQPFWDEAFGKTWVVHSARQDIEVIFQSSGAMPSSLSSMRAVNS